jgi:hypothetical protein
MKRIKIKEKEAGSPPLHSHLTFSNNNNNNNRT